MKTAQELRSGNVFRQNGELMIVMKTEFSKSGRSASVVKMKYKSLIAGRVREEVFRADDKFDDIVLDYKKSTFSYFSDPMYVFMDDEYNQHEINSDMMGDALNYLHDGMPAEVILYEGKAIAITMPKTVIVEVEYTEPAVRGDTVGKVMKPARIKGTGYEVRVPANIESGDKVEIDPTTDEFKRRAND